MIRRSSDYTAPESGTGKIYVSSPSLVYTVGAVDTSVLATYKLNVDITSTLTSGLASGLVVQSAGDFTVEIANPCDTATMAEIAFTDSTGTAVDLATGVEIVDRLATETDLTDVFTFTNPYLDVENPSLYIVEPVCGSLTLEIF